MAKQSIKQLRADFERMAAKLAEAESAESKPTKAQERKAQKVEDYLARLSAPTLNPDGTVSVSFTRANGKAEPIALSPFVSACIALARKSLK